MRFQSPIYIQNSNSGVRNRDILNVNMSSDICIFDAPIYTISGASKIDCSATTVGVSYIVSGTNQNIDLTFNFIGNTNSFVNTGSSFRFEIYKYLNVFNGFSSTPVYKSTVLAYETFSATNITLQSIPVDELQLDGEYIIKGYYGFPNCTNFLGKLGKSIDTKVYMSGNQFGLYNDTLDYYFIAMKQADIPILTKNYSNLPEVGKLTQQVLIPEDGQTAFNIQTNINGDFLVTLNGLVLAPDDDFTYSNNEITLKGETFSDDTITVVYSSSGGFALLSDNLSIDSQIVSGVTDNQGSELIYYNTTTNKFEIYTSTIPQDGGNVIVMLNGATLAGGIDFYQSTTNPKRIILQGELVVGDLITIAYFPSTGVVMGLSTNNPEITWKIDSSPTEKNGNFVLEVSSDENFNTYYYSGITDYIVGVSYYSHIFQANGTVGTKLYYRVRNDKKYKTFCGQLLTSTTYSEVIPIIIQTNSINSY